MNAAEQPIRHDFNFTMGEESKRKLDALMARCGQDNLNLLVARGLALVAWVEDQSDSGRQVGSIHYGADEPDFRPLEERPELTRRRPRPQLVTVPASAAQPVEAPVPEPVPEPAPTSAVNPEPTPKPARAAPAPVATTPERTPNEFNGPLAKPKPFRVPAKKADKLPEGYCGSPVRNLTELQIDARTRNVAAPIEYKGQPLPVGLNQSHAAALAENLALGATHFRLESDLALFAFKLVARKGWCTFETGRYRWVTDHWVTGGQAAIYSIKLAQDYLQNNAAPAPEPEPESETWF
ncbi:hypothetical protein [Pseudomonas sp. GD03730]|uniref:hypothetical protein n=1 Tax=Pseudomonas sp. GD03730 TaxID=2975375 RepID=UPI0024488E83|nr:hypothetical protein [Pseudomonas sp. GD03730]MDH1403701.1 hypothetical protein [Pseudomonas sp. GD03730]